MADKLIANLDEKTLTKTFTRLKKSTKQFSTLLIRDTIDFLDFEVTLKESLDTLASEINENNYYPQRPYLHESPKSKGINRPTVVFDIKDTLVYRFCIEQIEDVLIKKTRQENIRGGIKISPNRSPVSGGDFYEKWFKDWTAHMKSVRDSLEERDYLATTDIASYFENINMLVLKDMIRSDIEEKTEVMNLLFYFLENTRFRVDYEVNTFNGLPQEDIDCSRLLAYYFLHAHDDRMSMFCKEYDADFYRFVDDMSVSVKSPVDGKKALRCITESLRKLNLVSSIEKTDILHKKDALREMFYKENEKLTTLQDNITQKLEQGKKKGTEKARLLAYYRKLVQQDKQKQKNWIKVLRRFYTLATYTQADFLLDEVQQHLVSYPILFMGNRVQKYLLSIRGSRKFKHAIEKIIAYLYSEENLYPAVESNLIETLLLFTPEELGKQNLKRIEILAKDIFFKKNKYAPLSEYARALACLLYYRFNNKKVDVIAKYYIAIKENDAVLCKYLIYVSLTTGKKKLQEAVLKKARSEMYPIVNRLVRFLDNLESHKNLSVVKRYLKADKLYIYKGKVVEKYAPVRADILNKLIGMYS